MRRRSRAAIHYAPAETLSTIDHPLEPADHDRDTVRELVRRRKLTVEQRETADALMDQYLSALGDFAGTPLGMAGADRMREETRAE